MMEDRMMKYENEWGELCQVTHTITIYKLRFIINYNIKLSEFLMGKKGGKGNKGKAVVMTPQEFFQ